jgi:hypothetical protein
MLDDGPTLPLDHTLSADRSHVLDFLLSKKLAPTLPVSSRLTLSVTRAHAHLYLYREGDNRFTQKGETAYLETNRNSMQKTTGEVPIGAENNQTDVEKPRRDIDKTGTTVPTDPEHRHITEGTMNSRSELN